VSATNADDDDDESFFRVAIPRIKTQRLRLREFRRGDFEAFAAHNADPEATKYLSGTVDRRGAWRIFSGAIGAWSLNKAGWWALETLDTHEHVGTVGAFFRESSFLGDATISTHSTDLELGWSIYKNFWRRGYASEGAAAALAYALSVHRPPRVVAYVTPGNVASVGVAERIGMRLDKEISTFYEETALRFVLDP
jgi:RimJ/RimL family protein N-acetyltransferase